MKLVPRKTKENWLDPFQQFEDFSGFNRLLNYPRPFFPAVQDETFWGPAVDITDEKDKLLVKADIPGMSKDQIEVSVHNDVLTIKGEKKQEKETKEKDYVRTERFYGAFNRTLSLPTEVDGDKVKAIYKEGVLEIMLPKKEGAKSKMVKVQVH
jgi:HSP20 family protein